MLPRNYATFANHPQIVSFPNGLVCRPTGYAGSHLLHELGPQRSLFLTRLWSHELRESLVGFILVSQGIECRGTYWTVCRGLDVAATFYTMIGRPVNWILTGRLGGDPKWHFVTRCVGWVSAQPWLLHLQRNTGAVFSNNLKCQQLSA